MRIMFHKKDQYSHYADAINDVRVDSFFRQFTNHEIGDQDNGRATNQEKTRHSDADKSQ